MNRMVWLGWVVVITVCMVSGIAEARPGEGQGAAGMRAGGVEAGRGMGSGMDMGESRILRLLDSAKFAKEAGVSQAQVAEIKARLEVLRKEQIDLRAELEKAGLEQAKLISEKSADEEVLLAAVDKTSGIHAKIARNRMKQLLVVRKILTPQQTEKLYGMIEQRMAKNKGEAEGGPAAAPRGVAKEGDGAPAPSKEAGAPAAVPAEPAAPAAGAVNP